MLTADVDLEREGVSARRRRALRAIRVARQLRDAGMAIAEAADRDGWDRKVIDQAINAFARTGDPFSANDLRDLLPDVRPALIGARFYAASVQGRIVRHRQERVTSTSKSTHHKDVGLWVGVTT